MSDSAPPPTFLLGPDTDDTFCSRLRENLSKIRDLKCERDGIQVEITSLSAALDPHVGDLGTTYDDSSEDEDYPEEAEEAVNRNGVTSQEEHFMERQGRLREVEAEILLREHEVIDWAVRKGINPQSSGSGHSYETQCCTQEEMSSLPDRWRWNMVKSAIRDELKRYSAVLQHEERTLNAENEVVANHVVLPAALAARTGLDSDMDGGEQRRKELMREEMKNWEARKERLAKIKQKLQKFCELDELLD